jgi:hypothetical protein
LELTKNFFKIIIHKEEIDQPLILRAKAFLYVAKKNVAFATYATPMETSIDKSTYSISTFQGSI